MLEKFYCACRRTLAGLGAAAFVVGFSANGAAAQTVPERVSKLPASKSTPAEVEVMAPPSANPWLSLPGDQAAIDWDYWRMKRGIQSRNSAAMFSQRSNAVRRHTIAPGGEWPFTFLPDFGSSPWQDSVIDIAGEFDLPEPISLTPFDEDEGSIPLATEVAVSAGNAAVLKGEIGDGLYGSSGTGSGDIDFFVLRDMSAGQVITVDLDTPIPYGPLDPYVEIYNSEGVFLAANDDGDIAESFDSFLSFTVPEDGDYYISIAGYGTFFLLDPFDSSSGLGNIFGLPLSEGVYTATIGVDYFSEQDFVFFMKKGDVLGAAIDQNASLTIIDGNKTVRQASTQDLRFIMPAESPLPAGLVSVNHMVDTFGFYKLRVRSSFPGTYNLNLVAALPALTSADFGELQTIFIDFDGATVDSSESVTLSPLAAFLPNWGLGPEDEDAVIDAVMKVLKKSLVRDIKRKGGNPLFKIRLLNSRDHRDPFGEENVSRVIVGGTIDELGIPTIGIAESIDVGNFDTSETAYVLLDLLSSPLAGDPNSLNNVPRAEGVSIIDLIGVGLGEITAHEIGHYLGNWHTEQFNDQPNIMDQGGNLRFSILGVGADGIFGTSDDVDVAFGRDEYAVSEGLGGIEDTLTTIAWGSPIAIPFFRHAEADNEVIITPPADF